MRKGKRVLLISPSFPPYTSGAATYFEQLAQHVSASTSCSVIVLTTYHKEDKMIQRKGDYKLLRLIPNYIRRNIVIRLTVLPVATFFIMLLLWLRYRYNVIHVHSSTAITAGAGLVSKCTRIPIIYDVQDLMTSKWILRCGAVKKYIATGQQVRHRLQSFKISHKKIFTITSVPPLYDFKATDSIQKVSNQKVQFIFVGELNVKIKGIDILMDAFKEAARESLNISLTIVGTGPDKQYCKTYLEKNPELQTRVTLQGTLTNKQAMEAIAESDVLLLPSRTEGIPRVIIEAFLFGKPVIASRVGGIPDVVKDNENGILIEAGDSKELTRALLRIANSAELRDTLGVHAKAYARTLPTWDELTRDIIKIYESI